MLNVNALKSKFSDYFNVELKDYLKYPESFSILIVDPGVIRVIPSQKSKLFEMVNKDTSIKDQLVASIDTVGKFLGTSKIFFDPGAIFIDYNKEVDTYFDLLPNEILLSIISYTSMNTRDIFLYFKKDTTNKDVAFLMTLKWPLLIDILSKTNSKSEINKEVYDMLINGDSYINILDYLANNLVYFYRQNKTLLKVIIYWKYPLIYEAFKKDPILFDDIVNIIYDMDILIKVYSNLINDIMYIIDIIIGNPKPPIVNKSSIVIRASMMVNTPLYMSSKNIYWLFLLIFKVNDVLTVKDLRIILDNLRNFDTSDHSYSEIYKEKIRQEAPELFEQL